MISFIVLQLYFPKALKTIFLAGLLTYSVFERPSHPETTGQWY